MPGGNRHAAHPEPSAMLETWGRAVDAQLDQLTDHQIGVRRHLHEHPELSGQEVETTRLIAAQLREAGCSPTICQRETGVETGAFVDLTLGEPPPDGPLIGLRCDIDALPIPDAKTVEYRSRRDGITHACGHDAHTAIVLGVGLAVSRLKHAGQAALGSEENGPPGGVRLRLIFQPAEETSNGAEQMVAQGAMQGVDFILALHVDPERPAGKAGIRYGALTANCDEVELHVDGRGGHAARPHHTVDPIAAAAHLIGALYEFLPRRVDSRNPAVFTIGKIQGGTVPNVIPESVELLATLRTTDPVSRETMKIEIDRICSGAELSTGARIRRRFFNPLNAVINEARVNLALEESAREVLGDAQVETITLPSMGGEDFSVYLEHAPGAMLRLGCSVPGQTAHFLHSPLFDVDERILAWGSKILIRAALRLSVSQGSRASQGTRG